MWGQFRSIIQPLLCVGILVMCYAAGEERGGLGDEREREREKVGGEGREEEDEQEQYE